MLDSSAFYYGFHLSNSKKYYVTNLILDEVRHLLYSSIYDTFMVLGLLITMEPNFQSISLVKSTAYNSGDINRLTKADVSIISLAYQLGYPLISDDYPVQNVSKILGIKNFCLGTAGISNIRKWTNYCKTCNKVFSPNISECRLCGNKTRRRYKNQ